MGNFAKSNASTGSGFPLPEADFHNAIVAGLVDFGMVEQTWEAKTSEKHKIAVLYYLETPIPCDEGSEYEGNRFLSAVSYNFSFNSKATMYEHLVAGFGAEFVNNVDDLEGELLGKQVRILIDHAEKMDGSGKYAKVDSLRPAKDGVEVTMDRFELPKWIAEANTKGEVEAIAIFGT